jgi:uncharacterized membrane protein
VKPRLGLFDSLRGFAVVLMTIYHFCFDLAFVGPLRLDFTLPGWQAFRGVIVGLFTALAGAGFHLSEASFRAGPFRARLGRTLGGALFMTLASYILFPQAWIYFGILHFLFAASLLGPALARIPRLCFPLGAFALLTPFLWRSDWFAGAPLGITGLAPGKPDTIDFVPLFPWLGATMLGSWAGYFLLKRDFAFLRRESAALSFLGRHSLAYYLAHQAVLLPLAWVIMWLWGH